MNTDDYGKELLQPLDVDPAGPMSVDIGKAIADGRRQRRRNTALIACGTSAAVIAVAMIPFAVKTARSEPRTTAGDTFGAAAGASALAGPAAPTGCQIERLAVPDPANRPKSLVTGADPSGRFIVGRAYDSEGKIEVVLWKDGVPQRVPLAEQGGDAALRDVASDGTAVGETVDPQKPYVYRAGKLSLLNGVDNGGANAINDRGVIVGFSETADRVHDRPVMWPAWDRPAVPLSTPGPDWDGQALDVADDGTIVGFVERWVGSDWEKKPVMWRSDGTRVDLVAPAPGNYIGSANSISGDWIVGGVRWGDGRGLNASTDPARNADGKARPDSDDATVGAVRWNLRTGAAEIVKGFVPDQINQHGWIVGDDQIDANGKRITLPPLTPPTDKSWLVLGGTISDDGRIVAGQADDGSGEPQAVVWRCG